MLQLSDTRLHQIQQQISRQVAFPDELSAQFDESAAHQLLDEVKNCRDDAAVADLATLLPRRRLNDLFGALLVMSAATGEQTILRLLAILRQRITPSLAEVAWSFYQYHFFNDRMNRALQTTVRELADRGLVMPQMEAIRTSAEWPLLDETLPRRLADDYLKEVEHEPLDEAMVRLMILPDSPFAVHFLETCFTSGSDRLYQRDSDLFLYTLRLCGRDSRKALLTRYLSADRLDPVWQDLNTALLKQFGPPRPRSQQKLAELLSGSSDARIWDMLSSEVVDRFRQWEMQDRLARHISFSSRKKLFYQPLLAELRELSTWNQQTLILTFDRFYLVDDNDLDSQVYYYDRNTLDMMRSNERERPSLTQLKKPAPTAREIILSRNAGHIVCLQLDSVNLLYARDFMMGHLHPEKDLLS